MKRALCLWLPNWPLQRLAAARAELSDRSVVLYELHSSGGAKVAAWCPHLGAAASVPWLQSTSGIRPGMPLAEATALALQPAQAKALHLEQVDPAADRLALEQLAEWCHAFSPTVGVEESSAPESLLLDVTGLGKLSGGEASLARQIVGAFRQRRLVARVAVADTVGAAWAVAHYGALPGIDAWDAESGEANARSGGGQSHFAAQNRDSPRAQMGDTPRDILESLRRSILVAEGTTRAVLDPLPIAALRLPAETCGLLAELGLRRIEQLAALPREALLARFGPEVLVRLDQATGSAAEAIVARTVPPEWRFEWLFEHPTGRREMIEWAVEQLVHQVCQALARGRQGVLRLECRFEPEQGPAEQFIVGLYRPSASPRHVGELVQLKLEGVRFREPLVAVRVQVLALDQLDFHQQDFFAGDETRHAPRELAALVDRLGNRLGRQAVVRPWFLAGAQPEFVCQDRPLASLSKNGRRKPSSARKKKTKPQPETPATAAVAAGDRPLHLEGEPLPLAVISVAPEGPPVRFRWSGQDQRVTRFWGPERIETGWWRTRCVRRDYYQVETHSGNRYWLFRELNSGRWFLHGAFV